MEQTKTVSFIINPDTHKAIRKLAVERGMSIRTLVLAALAKTHKELAEYVEKDKGRF